MNSVNVRNLCIGEGIPKICVPIVATTLGKIIDKAKEIKNLPVDMVEWRADFFADVFDVAKVQEVLVELRKVLVDIPILFTFRTDKEGGEREITVSKYVELNKSVMDLTVADMIDVEMFFDENGVNELINYAMEKHIPVIGSYHNFEKTPAKEEILNRFQEMQEKGAAILKIAVMPETEEDVQILMETTKRMVNEYAKCPVVSMAMGEIGKVTRIKGKLFGSSITFGMVGEASAPGQIPVNELKQIEYSKIYKL